MLVPKHNPPAEYPVVIVRSGLTKNAFIPDLNKMLFNTDLEQVRQFIHHDLRARKDANAYHPYASSISSVILSNPDNEVVCVSTDGWDNLGALEAPSPEED